MTYIYYANKNSEAGEILNQMLQKAFKKSWMKRCRTLAELSKRLHEPISDIGAAALLIDDRKELEEILSLKDILWDIKVIIIFSGQANISTMEALALRPRFFTWTDADLSHVVDVLGNMMKCKPGRKAAIVTSHESNTAKI
jgi:hypothetical protein